jgi:hypothetical protein
MFKRNIINIKILRSSSVFFVLSYVVLPNIAQAVTISVTSSSLQISPKEAALVTVELDSEGKNINASEGLFTFDPNKFQLHAISFSNSIINAWIQTPQVEEGGTIKWSGVIPGGFSGVRSSIYDGTRPGIIFQAIFTAVATGTPEFNFSELTTYANDGNGTILDSKNRGAVISVVEGTPRSAFLPQKISFNQDELYKGNLNKVGSIGVGQKISLFIFVILASVTILIFRSRKFKKD